MQKWTAQCCISGGGPAGMMLGLLLARAGVGVTVLEKHGDFLRDFRGDTVHPSTLEIIHELGLLDDFLSRPHQKVERISGFIESEMVPFADFTGLPSACKFLVLMPQWDFLDFLSDHAKLCPTFTLKMNAKVTRLIEEKGRVVGLGGESAEGPFEVRSDLVVAADGRHSVVRELAGLEVQNFGAPIDVLWMRIPRIESDANQPLGRINQGQVLAMLYRGDYWQCALVIPKGEFENIKQAGLSAFHARLLRAAPFLEARVREIKDWEQVKLLTVRVDRLKKWYRDGLLCIGDSAHAMSPIGGVGINLAIQDAVAAANLLGRALKAGKVTTSLLCDVQKRRLFPTRVIQRGQVIVQNRVITRILRKQRPLRVPRVLRLFQKFPAFRSIPARIVGLGIRPEHVRIHP